MDSPSARSRSRRGVAYRSSFFFLSAFLLAAACLGCASSPEVIRDIRTLPQSNVFYLDATSADTELLSPERQRASEEEYKARFLAPWRQERPAYGKDEMEREFRKFGDKPGYGENRRKHDAGWVEKLAANAGIEGYPNAFQRAVTLTDSDLRLLPTRKPSFSTLEENAGSGYPFDNVQNSLAPANTPILITHVSVDKSWLFVESHTGFGWIPAENAARIDPSIAATWQRSPHATIVREEIPVYGENGLFLLKGHIGSHFPMVGEDADAFRVLVAVADENRNARLVTARLPKKDALVRPMKLTRANIAAVADELINQPYGWGGMYGNRDCSAMLQDLFAPFGFWLPRHSSDQAAQGGKFVNLSGMSRQEKERLIRRDGVPYFTLLWMKGHIVLYIGCHEGRPLVFQNVWGVRTKSPAGTEGRHVIGHAAITTLQPGAELTDRNASAGDMLDRIQGMTLLGQP